MQRITINIKSIYLIKEKHTSNQSLLCGDTCTLNSHKPTDHHRIPPKVTIDILFFLDILSVSINLFSLLTN